MADTGKPNGKAESAVERIRNLNDRIVEAVKDSGKESLETYERVLENLADGFEAAGEGRADWIQELARTQAEFTRKLADAFPALLERLGMYTREPMDTGAVESPEEPGRAYAVGRRVVPCRARKTCQSATTMI